MYLEMVGERFRKVTIADICYMVAVMVTREGGGSPGALPMTEQERRPFPSIILALLD